MCFVRTRNEPPVDLEAANWLIDTKQKQIISRHYNTAQVAFGMLKSNQAHFSVANNCAFDHGYFLKTSRQQRAAWQLTASCDPAAHLLLFLPNPSLLLLGPKRLSHVQLASFAPVAPLVSGILLWRVTWSSFSFCCFLMAKVRRLAVWEMGDTQSAYEEGERGQDAAECGVQDVQHADDEKVHFQMCSKFPLCWLKVVVREVHGFVVEY